MITYWINSEDTPIGNGGAFRHYKYNLEKLPIPKPDKQTEQQIEELLQEKDYEKIDAIIYSLFELNEEEINSISTFDKSST